MAAVAGTQFCVPYPPLEKLGVIGDRRTAALIAADGSLCWMCHPNYDGAPTFGALLDFENGGLWKLGPKSPSFGEQSYLPNTFLLRTLWKADCGVLELIDCMGLPEDARSPSDTSRRVVLRRLKCLAGNVGCNLRCEPRHDNQHAFPMIVNEHQALFFDGECRMTLWSSVPIAAHGCTVDASFQLSARQEAWCAFGPEEDVTRWNVRCARQMLSAARQFWLDRANNLHCRGERRDRIRRSALLVDLLTFAPTGAVIASPSASLPERIGGRRNYDYRFTWIRDASLAIALHSKIGSTVAARRFIEWLCGLKSNSEMPFQALYRINGEAEAPVIQRNSLHGYRGSQPVRFGNAAMGMFEIDSFGYLADCVLTYLENGGAWDDRLWNLIVRIAEFTASNWHRKGASIWEIWPEQEFVISKVMSWVTLDRALRIAEKIRQKNPKLAAWQRARDEIHAEVMNRGWSDRLGSFRQRYDTETVDASLLLLPIMDFIPALHPRVTSTMERIREQLEINGLLHRFVPRQLPGQGSEPLGEEEGAFLMCSFWLARVHAIRDEIEEAEAILGRAEAFAGPLGLFAEGVDARSGSFLGNTPLLFSQVEYAEAALALTQARSPPPKDSSAKPT